MSGIAGILRFDGHPAETAHVEDMVSAMARRGPDGGGAWSGGSVALAHLMMHTTPESLSERQPLLSADGARVLVVDGRVDNREELAAALAEKDTAPADGSDAALFLAAYEAWGDDFCARIEGDFALVLWDARRRAAICARDRVGAKPFAYHWDGRRFAFASEIRPVLDLPWVEAALDEATLAQHLMCDLRSFEGTFWRGLHRLTPGHRMIVTADGPRSAFYWRLDLGRRLNYRRDEEYVEHYRALLEDVVRRMSRSHRPLAFEVSGGLDSSALFAVADGLEREGRLRAPGVDGYTLRFDPATDADELDYVHAVSRHLGRPVRELAPTDRPLAWYEAEAQRFADFPGSANGVMEAAIRDAATAAGSRVLVRGVGGDEILGGTRERYAETILRGEFRRLPGMFAAEARDLGARGALRSLLGGGVFPLLPAGARRSVRRLRGARAARRPSEAWLAPRLTALFRSLPEPPSPLSGLLFDGQRPMLRWLCHPFTAHSLELSERQSAGSLEIREPFCNAALVSFLAAVPERLLLAGASTKHLHRLALRERLPRVLLDRRGKAELSCVFWPLIAELRERALGGDRLFAPELVDTEALRTYLAGVGDRPYMSLDMWRVWFLAACAPLASTEERRTADADVAAGRGFETR